MRSSFYIFTFIGKKFLIPKFLGQKQTAKERTVAKPFQLKRKKKNLQMHTQMEELRKNVQQRDGCVCVCACVCVRACVCLYIYILASKILFYSIC